MKGLLSDIYSRDSEVILWEPLKARSFFRMCRDGITQFCWVNTLWHIIAPSLCKNVGEYEPARLLIWVLTIDPSTKSEIGTHDSVICARPWVLSPALQERQSWDSCLFLFIYLFICLFVLRTIKIYVLGLSHSFFFFFLLAVIFLFITLRHLFRYIPDHCSSFWWA
jgi:hypothetical protein